MKISNIVEAVEEGQAHCRSYPAWGSWGTRSAIWKKSWPAMDREKPRISLNMAEAYASKVRGLVDALPSSESDGGVREAIRDMVGKVTIQPCEGRQYAAKVTGKDSRCRRVRLVS